MPQADGRRLRRLLTNGRGRRGVQFRLYFLDLIGRRPYFTVRLAVRVELTRSALWPFAALAIFTALTSFLPISLAAIVAAALRPATVVAAPPPPAPSAPASTFATLIAFATVNAITALFAITTVALIIAGVSFTPRPIVTSPAGTT
jgi:hypothetical protein